MKLWILKFKYFTLRKWLVQEMVREGWRADTEKGRLVRDEADGRGGIYRVNLAQHEAIARHLKEYPLF